MKHILSQVLFTMFMYSSYAQLQVIPDSPQNLVMNTLIGANLQVSNIQYNGAPNAIGRFYSSNTLLGMDSGIVITTGSIFNMPGPNNSTSTSTDNSLTFSDPDLIAVDPIAIYDPAILSFDFVAAGDSMIFDYVFGSEEYHDYVNTACSDLFVIIIKGVSDTSYTRKNIALLPGTSTPISINNVNNGNSFNCLSAGPCLNCAYFIDNCNGWDLQYDGITTALTAVADSLTVGETYRLKISIADACDWIFDSGIFLKGCSFRSGPEGYCSTTSANETNENNILVLYPNPAHDRVVVSVPAFPGTGTEILLFSSTGNLVKKVVAGKKEGNSGYVLELDGLSSGLYMVLVKAGDTNLAQPLVIE